jgi:hypothetical protein
MVAALLTVLLLLAWGISVLHGKSIAPFSLGLGNAHAAALVLADDTNNPGSMSVLANAPQLILSLIYITYSGLMTSMFLADDWARMASTPQYLMVGSPVGRQRGTWLLGLPGVYGWASLGLQALMHWLVSQSIFAVSIDIYSWDGKLDPAIKVSNCGYSPLAMVAAAVAGLVLLVSAYAMGMRKFKPGAPPVAGTCSSAISAACHLPVGVGSGEKMVFEAAKWGAVVSGASTVNQTRHTMWNQGVSHCSIAPKGIWDTGMMGEPRPGGLYAGLEGESWF